MTAPLVHAHDSRIHFKLDEIEDDLQKLATEDQATLLALDEAGIGVRDARQKVFALIDRRKEIAADIAILREMLGVR